MYMFALGFNYLGTTVDGNTIVQVLSCSRYKGNMKKVKVDTVLSHVCARMSFGSLGSRKTTS
jgi:hypothetical protein